MVRRTFTGKVVNLAISCVMATGLAACGSGSNQAQPAAEAPKTEAAAGTGASADTKKEAWQIEWEKTVEAAKQEGEVVVFGLPTNREGVMEEFEKAFPGIKVKYSGMNPTQMTTKILAEQQQNKFLVDITLENAAVPSENIQDNIILPDVKDDKNWNYGYEAGYKMAQGDYKGQFAFSAIAYPYVYINNDMIPEGEIKSLEDLLDPKWSGKIIAGDFSYVSSTMEMLNAMSFAIGKDFVDKLVDQQKMAVNPESRLATEQFATGKYPIGIGINNEILRDYRNQGVVSKVTKLQPEKSPYLLSFTTAIVKNPPHPNAAKVFMNWFLSKEGQTHYVNYVKEFISRRSDAPRSPYEDIRSWDKIDYQNSSFEPEPLGNRAHMIELGKKALKSQ
ncbi:ABC transporter substrate-binding protein [Brevibacillus nitrificans]|uniref:ABC transporter substrate-binding protein n=1 Tax=Brevibacillus nitrificans TaxID=651560 RepID=UPI00261E03CF|nr:extracellular solute-binding protein [Brevibacillus nitrificans]MED1796708.1 extracellular solute-binding protein [Brevibacillus nitrificans]